MGRDKNKGNQDSVPAWFIIPAMLLFWLVFGCGILTYNTYVKEFTEIYSEGVVCRDFEKELYGSAYDDVVNYEMRGREVKEDISAAVHYWYNSYLAKAFAGTNDEAKYQDRAADCATKMGDLGYLKDNMDEVLNWR
ncbi:MAG: hypothetical protein HUJ70_09825 [Pseudobutyrivibrio sp.]|nr:hypothetical protein [Pseudobutyrivibrio sp.]